VLTLGQILQKARKKKGKPLSSIARETKISARFLKALENNHFKHLPPGPFTKGFIKNYAQAVDLPYEKALAIFRRDFIVDKKGKIKPKNLTKSINEPNFFTPKVLKILGIFLAIIFFSIYLGFQLKSFFAPPNLTIYKPEDGARLKGPIISVEGKVSADSSIKINDQLAEVDSLGLWRKKLEVLPGKNQIEVKAINRRNKETKKELSVEVVDK
jgi:transcriptional regulator with XRE-family HTH domain